MLAVKSYQVEIELSVLVLFRVCESDLQMSAFLVGLQNDFVVIGCKL